MKRQFSALILFFLSLLSFIAFAKNSPKDLPAAHRKWLQEEVAYIISPKEKEVFLALETDRERDLFIEAFWKQRDPTPGTAENEFKQQHYKRIEFANRTFAREATGAGWRTDMGRIYIILGPPKDIEDYDGQKDLYSTQIWTYDGDPALGLPSAFHVVFYKRNGVGDYVLYSPVKDGPQSLIPGYMGDATNVTAIFNRLMTIEPNVAQVALSLIPGSREQFDPTTRSFASDILISVDIPAAPYKMIETAYAEKLLKYKDIIEVEYTANYIDNDALVEVIQDPSGIYFVHYSLEPKKLSIAQYGNTFATTLDVNGMVMDAAGKAVYQFNRSLPLEFNADQVDKIKSKLFSSQDMFPLIEGSYKFSLLLKNTVSKEFTSVENELLVPNDRSLQLGPLILAYRAIPGSTAPGTLKPFLVGNIQLVPSPRNDFSRADDRLYLFFQVYGLGPELRSQGLLEFTLANEKETVLARTRPLDSTPETSGFLEEFDISQLPPATYSLKVALLDKDKNRLLEKEEFFFISHASSLPRPWVLSQVSPAVSDPVYANILGNQYLNKKDVDQALPLLEKAYREKADRLKYALDYARALFLREKYAQARDILLPFSGTETSHGELFGLLGSLYQKLGNFEEAVSHYKEALKRQGTNLNILNAIGECYYKLGNKAEALIAWEKSLEINPKQEEIRRIVQSVKKD